MSRGFRPASLPTAATRDRRRLSLLATMRQEVLGMRGDPDVRQERLQVHLLRREAGGGLVEKIGRIRRSRSRSEEACRTGLTTVLADRVARFGRIDRSLAGPPPRTSRIDTGGGRNSPSTWSSGSPSDSMTTPKGPARLGDQTEAARAPSPTASSAGRSWRGRRGPRGLAARPAHVTIAACCGCVPGPADPRSRPRAGRRGPRSHSADSPGRPRSTSLSQSSAAP